MSFTKEAPGRLRTPHARASSFGPRFRVTEFARGRDLIASPPGIERVMGPFDFGVFAQRVPLYVRLRYALRHHKINGLR